MSTKIEKIQNAIQGIKQKKFVLYHVISPISQNDFIKIKESGFFEPSKNALGGQSDGYYFFTTYYGAKHHLENNKDLYGNDADKHAYLVECEIDLDSVKYPNWKLDYEALQDFFFDMIYNVATIETIKCYGIEINALKDNKLAISDNGKFSRIKQFCANDHTGLIEKVSDFLYVNNKEFRNAYDKLLRDVFDGIGSNLELCAVKTTEKHKITKITEIENQTVAKPAKHNSQIDKFMARYGRGSH